MPHSTNPSRQEVSVDARDRVYGQVRIRVIDRISVDDVTLHLIKRELFRLAGGADPGDELNPLFIDFLVKENYVV
jgi:hypothetical protein